MCVAMAQVEERVGGCGDGSGGGGPSKGVGEGSFHPIGRVPDIQSASSWPSQQISVRCLTHKPPQTQ